MGFEYDSLDQAHSTAGFAEMFSKLSIVEDNQQQRTSPSKQADMTQVDNRSKKVTVENPEAGAKDTKADDDDEF